MTTQAWVQRMDDHELRIEGDLIFVKWSGDLRLEHVRQLLLCIEEAERVHERVFLIADARMGTKIDADARKLAIGWKLPHDLAGAAIFGASVPLGILLNMLTKALHTLRGIMTPVQFVRTEEAARAWIDAERRKGSSGRPVTT